MFFSVRTKIRDKTLRLCTKKEEFRRRRKKLRGKKSINELKLYYDFLWFMLTSELKTNYD